MVVVFDKMGSTSQILVKRHNTPSDFLTAAYNALLKHEETSNIVLAHALQRLTQLHGPSQICDNQHIQDLIRTGGSEVEEPGAFWLTVWTEDASNGQTLDIVVSCLTWSLGKYPVFLWTPFTPATIGKDWQAARVMEIAQYLCGAISPKRVFSVFGQRPLVETFSQCWKNITAIPRDPTPWYEALFTFCKAGNLKGEEPDALPPGHVMRDATHEDREGLAELCQEFAATSVFFPLTLEVALQEADELIEQKEAMIYLVQEEITTICAVTRSSVNVSAITKVFTREKWRRQGFAEHLVRRVTKRLLTEHRKKAVVLYVGMQNTAQHVYSKVGFVGLAGSDPVAGVEEVLEVGFIGSDKGHW